MGDYERHHAAGVHLFPLASLGFVVPIYFGTDDPTLVLLTLVLGGVLVRLGAVLPDIDTPDSIPRRALGRALTGALLGVLFLSSVKLVVPMEVFPALLAALPLGFAPAVLLVVLFLWRGLASRHRSVTHSIAWGVALSLAFGVTAVTSTQWSGLRPATVVGTAAATYCFVGFYSHVAVDDEFQIWPEPDTREFDEYRKFLTERTEQFRKLAVPTVVGGLALASSGVVVLVGAVTAYVGLLGGLTLPRIERKKSEPRRYFDRVGTLIVTGLLVQQLFAAGFRLRNGTVAAVLELPAGTVPAFYLLLLVLWLGRDLGGPGPDEPSITHSLLWPGAVCATVVLVVVTGTSGLPVGTTAYLATVAGVSLLVGFYHHFRVKGIIVPPSARTDE